MVAEEAGSVRAELIIFNKPYGVLSQFTDRDGRATLADYIEAPDFYPAGRLDADSEGLLLLTDNGALQARISSPRFKLWKRYWVLVEGAVERRALDSLRSGVPLSDGRTRPARARRIPAPALWPPQREARGPTSWLEVQLQEGRNRQLRRMTAAVGHPTLRLVRAAVGDWALDGLQPGEYRRCRIHLPEGGRVRPARSGKLGRGKG